METIQRLLEARLQVWTVKQQLWDEGFLTPSWWFIAITIAAMYAVWWKLVD